MRKQLFLSYLFLIVLTTVSCNKDDTTLSDPTNPGGSVVTDEKRVQILEEVETFMNALTWTNRKETYQQLVAYLKTIPQFEDAGYAEETNNVWARFTDG